MDCYLEVKARIFDPLTGETIEDRPWVKSNSLLAQFVKMLYIQMSQLGDTVTDITGIGRLLNGSSESLRVDAQSGNIDYGVVIGDGVSRVMGTDGNSYITSYLPHVSSASSRPVTGGSWATYWTVDSYPWGNGWYYNLQAKVIGTDGQAYECISNHWSDPSTQPVSGGNWSLYWSLISPIETWQNDFYYSAIAATRFEDFKLTGNKIISQMDWGDTTQTISHPSPDIWQILISRDFNYNLAYGTVVIQEIGLYTKHSGYNFCLDRTSYNLAIYGPLAFTVSYRITINLNQLEYTDFAPHNMVSPFLPAPYGISASSQKVGLEAYKAFDGGVGASQYWSTSDGNTIGWIAIDLGVGNSEPLTGYSFKMNSIPEPNKAPYSWTVEGSNDNITWDTIGSEWGITGWESGESRGFTTWYPTTSYRFYRFTISANNGDPTNLQIGEIYLYKSV